MSFIIRIFRLDLEGCTTEKVNFHAQQLDSWKHGAGSGHVGILTVSKTDIDKFNLHLTNLKNSRHSPEFLYIYIYITLFTLLSDAIPMPKPPCPYQRPHSYMIVLNGEHTSDW